MDVNDGGAPIAAREIGRPYGWCTLHVTIETGTLRALIQASGGLAAALDDELPSEVWDRIVAVIEDDEPGAHSRYGQAIARPNLAREYREHADAAAALIRAVDD